MESEPNKENKDNNYWEKFFVLAVILGIFVFFVNLFTKKTSTKFYPKSELVKLYRVDIKTINKWVAVFCDQNTLPFDTYKKKRKLPEDMYNYIVECLGKPSPDMPVLSKFQIVTGCEEFSSNEYRGVRNSIRLSSGQIDISPDIYAMFNVFPPKIAHIISQKVA